MSLDVPDELWVSDPEAEQALERFLQHEPPFRPFGEIRCMGHGRDQQDGTVIGEVWLTRLDLLPELDHTVLRLFYWPSSTAETRARHNVKSICQYLKEAGDEGLYCCARHGVWRADLRVVRERLENQLSLRGTYDTVHIPAWPPGTTAPPRNRKVDALLDQMRRKPTPESW